MTLRPKLLSGKFPQALENRWHLNGEMSSKHSNVSVHLCKEHLTVVKNTVHTPEKVLNVLIYGSLRFDEIQYAGEHVKWPQCVNGESSFSVQCGFTRLLQKIFNCDKM